MDSHVLRRIALELAPQIIGARLETVYCPQASTFTFKIGKPALQPYLIFHFGCAGACILPAFNKPVNPDSPDAPTMRLRKYLCGKRLNHIWLDWNHNALYLGFASRKRALAPIDCEHRRLQSGNNHTPAENPGELEHTYEESGCLCLDMRSGASLREGPPEGAEDLSQGANAARWNIQEAAYSLGEEALGSGQPWRQFPFLTPLLRKTLAATADPAERLALLADLENATGDIFLYTDPGNAKLPQLTAWPLPAPLIPPQLREEVHTSVLEALETGFTRPLFDMIAQAAAKTTGHELKQRQKRALRALDKLAREEEQLQAKLAEKQAALLIQAKLYELDKEARPAELDLCNEYGDKRTISLNPLKTIAENMEQMFKQAAKATRGLPHIARRRAELKAQLENLEADVRLWQQGMLAPKTSVRPGRTQPEKANQGKPEKSAVQTQVARFISPSGLLLLRGKSAKGNQEALRMAAPCDFWLHVEGGPGAHLIIRLPHAAHAVPEQDMEMAARLVAEKSWQRNEHRATVICARAKDVHPLKGGAPGAVRVDRIWRTLMVNTQA